MAGNNSLTLNIVAKVQDKLIGKLESKMKTVISTAKKLETATGKGFDKLKTINVRGIENLNNKIKPLITGMAGLSVKFSNLKSKIASSFPTEKINNMKTKLTELKSKVTGVGGAFGGLKSMIVGLAGAFAVFSFASSSVGEYKEALVSATKLQSNLNTVQSYKGNQAVIKQNLGLLQNQQKELQKIGVFDGDLIGAGQAQLSTFQMTGKEIASLTPKMADIVANQKGMNAEAGDFYSTANMIGKAISTGQLASLRKVGIAISDAEMAQFKHATQTEKVALMNKILANNVGDVNKNLANTDLGKLQNMQNQYNDMKETVGKGVVTVLGALAPAVMPLIPIIEKIAILFSDTLVNSISFIKPLIDNVFKGFNNIGGMQSLQKLGETTMSLFTSVGTSLGALFTGIDFGVVIKGIVDGITSFIDIVTQGINFIKPVLDPILFAIGRAVTLIAPFLPMIMKIVGVVALLFVGFSVLFNPITWIILAVTAVINIIGSWKAIVSSVGAFFTSIFLAIGNFFMSIWNGLTAYINFVINTWILIFTTAFNVIKVVIQTAINVVKLTISGIVMVATNVFNTVQNVAVNAFNGAKAIITGVIDKIKGGIQGIIDVVHNITSAVKQAFNPANWKVPNIKIPFIGKNYTGTKNWRGGLTTVAEKGQEIIKPPSGKPFLAQSEMMLNLPSGTEILNNAETQKELTTQPKSNKLSNSVNTSPSSVSTSTTSTNNKTSANNISISQVFNVYETGKDSIDKLKSEMRKGVEEVINSMFAGNLVAKGEI